MRRVYMYVIVSPSVTERIVPRSGRIKGSCCKMQKKFKIWCKCSSQWEQVSLGTGAQWVVGSPSLDIFKALLRLSKLRSYLSFAQKVGSNDLQRPLPAWLFYDFKREFFSSRCNSQEKKNNNQQRSVFFKKVFTIPWKHAKCLHNVNTMFYKYQYNDLSQEIQYTLTPFLLLCASINNENNLKK